MLGFDPSQMMQGFDLSQMVADFGPDVLLGAINPDRRPAAATTASPVQLPTTSPPERVAIAARLNSAVLSPTNRTDPSPIVRLQPPSWKL